MPIVETVTYPNNATVEYSYNNVGYTELVTDSEGIQWQGEYDKAGRLIAEKGRPGIDKQYSYDELDRIKTVSIAGTVVESYSYGEKGTTVTFTDGKGANYTYIKDEFGRLVKEIDRLGQSQQYSYDDSGTLEEKEDFSKNTTEILYDANTRTQTTYYEDGSQSIIRYNMAGQIIEAINETGKLSYSYNKAGLLESQSDVQGGETTYYSYDKAGRRTLLRSNNREIAYGYGKNSELLSVEDNIQRLYVSYTYDNMMREVSRTFGNGVSQYTEYDSIGRTSLITEKSFG